MKRWIGWITASVALAGCIVPAAIPSDKAAPPFKGQGLDQKHYSLLDLALKGPVLVFFIPKNCQEASKRVVFANLLTKAYGDDLSVLGVYGGNESELSDWSMDFDPKFPVVPDLGLLIAEKYKLQQGPMSMVVTNRGRIEGRWTEWSQADFVAMNTLVGRLLQREPAKIDLKGAPSTAVPPCKYDLPERLVNER